MLVYLVILIGCVSNRDIVTSELVRLTDSSKKAMILEQLHIDTKISGNIAQTTLEFSFYNPNDSLLEGSLEFPLLDGQRVVKHALEINGKYRESVVVDKSKAKKVFEDVIRRQVDPSLIEKTIGNNFRLRLYPLLPKKSKKVKVTIEEILHRKFDNYEYKIPFVVNDIIKDFAIDIVTQSKQKPIFDLFGREKKSFSRYRDGYKFSYEKKNVRLNKNATLIIPILDEISSYYQETDGKRLFMSVIHKAGASVKKSTSKKEKLQLIWDCSLSEGQSSREKKFEFLETLFTQDIEYEIELYTLGLGMKKEGSYVVNKGNWRLLKEKLKTIRYHGAKDLSAVQISKDVDRVLLFTNGLNTFSDELFENHSKTLYTINTNVKSAPNVLKYLAKVSGGKYINLLRDSSNDALKKFRTPSGTKVVNKSDNIDEVYIEERGESLIVLGSMHSTSGRVTIEHGDKSYEVVLDEAKKNPYIARLWGTQKIDRLSLNKRKNKKEMMEIAKRYEIVTSFTSMIVLDSLEDYVRYEIVPPEELLEEYNKIIQRKKRNNSKESAIKEVIRLINEQKEWYAKVFPKERPKPKSKRDSLSDEGSSGDINPVTVFEVEPVVVPVEAVPVPSPVVAMPVSLTPVKKAPPKKVKLVASEPKINLKEWSSNASYMQEIQKVEKSKRLEYYFTLQQKHRDEASFYTDMSDYFYKHQNGEFSLEILSNLLELDYENSELLRVFAFKLLEHKEAKKSIHFFEMVAQLRPFEAQSSRDLALALEQVEEYQKALALHYKILTTHWDRRFGGSKIVTVNEMNHLIRRQVVDSSMIDSRLITHMPVDMRIVINWSTDNSDMDLWVIDPLGEKTYYGNRESYIGGKISNDMTQGYGPEEFMIREAVKGKYTIKVKYYASHQQKIAGPTVIRAEVYTKYGYNNEKRQDIIFRVEDEKDVVELGDVSY